MAKETYNIELDLDEKHWAKVDHAIDAAKSASLQVVSGGSNVSIGDNIFFTNSSYFRFDADQAGIAEYKCIITLKSGGVDVFFIKVRVV